MPNANGFVDPELIRAQLENCRKQMDKIQELIGQTQAGLNNIKDEQYSNTVILAAIKNILNSETNLIHNFSIYSRKRHKFV